MDNLWSSSRVSIDIDLFHLAGNALYHVDDINDDIGKKKII